MNIITRELNILEYKDCEWQKKIIDTDFLPEQEDIRNCGTFLPLYAYQMTINVYMPKSTEDKHYLHFFRKFMCSCYFERNKNDKPTMSNLG